MEPILNKVEGSIVLKIFIVAMAVVLYFSMSIPNELWTLETREEYECHFRLLSLTDAQQAYKTIHFTFTDTLDNLLVYAQNEPSFRGKVDSIFQTMSDADTTDQNITSKLHRLNLATAITLDSMFTCPSSGLPYTMELSDAEDDGESYKILCPTESHKVTIYSFFEMKYNNHGEINQSKDVSWE